MPGPQDPKTIAKLSVQDRAHTQFKDEAPITIRIASWADEFAGRPWDDRDKQLSNFWPTEPILAGAVYSLVAKVAALDFKLRGQPKTRQRYRNILLSADLGSGWVSFICKVVLELLTQDNGAFIELLRPRGAPARSPVRGIAHVDSQRCERTGVLAEPVHYRPDAGHPQRIRGPISRDGMIPFKWYEIVMMADLPSPREEHKGRGLCAVSRILRAAQTLRDIGIYKRQKIAGKRPPALIFAQGLRRNAIRDAIKEALAEQQAEGRTVYTSPIIMASADASQPLNIKMVELGGLPDGYDEDTTLKWYIAQLALGFGVDYTEFAPLPGGNLGSATQTTEMAARARGKGPGVLLQQMEFAINWWILPQGLEFQFASTDPSAEAQRVEMSLQRAKERQIRVNTQEITPQQALQLAIQEGDAPAGFAEDGEGGPLEDLDDRIDTIVKSLANLQDSYATVERMVHKTYAPARTKDFTGEDFLRTLGDWTPIGLQGDSTPELVSGTNGRGAHR